MSWISRPKDSSENRPTAVHTFSLQEKVLVKVWEASVQRQEKVPEKVWEALVQSQVRFNRVPDGRLRCRAQVQQGSGEGSGEG